MTPSFVRKKLDASQTVVCAKACYQDPESVELLASSGFDAIWICLEHKRIDPALVYSLIQACRLGGADALIRVRPSSYADVLWLLEAGARGLMIPRIRHPDEVRAIVDMAKFMPQGRRGCDSIHVDADFGRLPLAEYFAQANRENFLAIQIEEPEVVPHIDAIAAIPGVDVLFVGPGDLTIGLGKPNQTDDPEVQKILLSVVEACRRHGKCAAIPCSPNQVAKYRALGYSFFNVFSDYRGVSNGARQALTDAGIGKFALEKAS